MPLGQQREQACNNVYPQVLKGLTNILMNYYYFPSTTYLSQRQFNLCFEILQNPFKRESHEDSKVHNYLLCAGT